MTLDIKRAKHKDIFVERVQVTEENMKEVAEWCSGRIEKTSGGTRFIKVRVIFPRTDKQTKAFVGDYVLYSPTGYKIYTEPGYHKSFVDLDDDGNEIPEEEIESFEDGSPPEKDLSDIPVAQGNVRSPFDHG